MAPLIGYYAHHHGSGHRHRARLVAAAYPGPVSILGSHDDATVVLPPDHEGASPVDPSAHGTLHWAPRHSELLVRRNLALLEWAREAAPALVVVDVSVEVAVQLRLAGIPVVVVRQHGDRTDPPHQLAYALAEALLAPYADWAEDATATTAMRERTRYVGGFSRFVDRPAPDGGRDASEVVVVIGRGGTAATPGALARLAVSSSRHWTVLGLDGPCGPHVRFLGEVDDPWPHLCRAGAVVVSAGHSALCEAAAANAPTLAVAETRPFDEQIHKVEALVACGAVRAAPGWDDPVGWSRALDELAQDPPRWRDFVAADAPARAAEFLAETAAAVTKGS